jgi:hypothetical protein
MSTNNCDRFFLVLAKDWGAFEKAVHQAESETGIGTQFSENIDRWSQVSYLDYRKHLKKYKKFQQIEVFLLNPYFWSIGKITRYWDSDIQDMIAVFKKEKVDPVQLAKLWRQALQQSPRSTELFLTKQHVVQFFTTYGARIWGDSFSLLDIKKFF